MNERKRVDAIARTLIADFNYTTDDAYRVAYSIVRADTYKAPSKVEKILNYLMKEKQYLFLLFAFILANGAAFATSIPFSVMYAISAILCVCVSFAIAMFKVN